MNLKCFAKTFVKMNNKEAIIAYARKLVQLSKVGAITLGTHEECQDLNKEPGPLTGFQQRNLPNALNVQNFNIIKSCSQAAVYGLMILAKKNWIYASESDAYNI